MKIYFDNDRTFGKSAVGIPVTVDEKPIGFVQEVYPDRVVCMLWDKFVGIEQDHIIIGHKEQDIKSIYLCTKG